MQSSFRAMSKERGLWHGATVATNQDLSGIYVVRAVELYLKPHVNVFMTYSAVDFVLGGRPQHWIHPRTTNPIESTFATPGFASRPWRGVSCARDAE
jgi:hypothetical protein